MGNTFAVRELPMDSAKCIVYSVQFQCLWKKKLFPLVQMTSRRKYFVFAHRCTARNIKAKVFNNVNIPRIRLVQFTSGIEVVS